MKSVTIAALAGALALGLSGAAQADPLWLFDSGDFHAAGTILSTTDFDAFGANITVLTDNETFGPLTFSGGQLLTLGPDSYRNPVKTVISNNYPTDFMNIDVGPTGYNMLAFRMGNLEEYDEQVFLALTTNVDTYYYGMYPQPAPEALSFYGFIVPEGEYFTGLQFNHTAENHSWGLTDIELGKTGTICNTRICDGPSPAPEPGAWALMILGFGAAGAALRHRRRTLSVLA